MKAERPQQAVSFAGSVVSRYHEDLFRFITSRLRDSTDVADVAQEVYLRLLRVQDDADIRDPLGYVFRTASNVLSEFQMRRSRESECLEFDTEAMEAVADNPPQPPQDELVKELSIEDNLMHALEKLPDLYRKILMLRLADGLSYDEVGRKLELSAHTVKKYYFKALTLIRMASQD